mmetsp:Transcript_25709/g.50101  ORF Transcript_25709/g.50101 Transcript_25709/m.50101 type:complete len:319 (+) Transcript_25709:148-1104(+)
MRSSHFGPLCSLLRLRENDASARPFGVGGGRPPPRRSALFAVASCHTFISATMRTPSTPYSHTWPQLAARGLAPEVMAVRLLRMTSMMEWSMYAWMWIESVSSGTNGPACTKLLACLVASTVNSFACGFTPIVVLSNELGQPSTAIPNSDLSGKLSRPPGILKSATISNCWPDTVDTRALSSMLWTEVSDCAPLRALSSGTNCCRISKSPFRDKSRPRDMAEADGLHSDMTHPYATRRPFFATLFGSSEPSVLAMEKNCVASPRSASLPVRLPYVSRCGRLRKFPGKNEPQSIIHIPSIMADVIGVNSPPFAWRPTVI